MAYFSRRNEYIVEYSGHEEVSNALRERLIGVMNRYIDRNVSLGAGPAWFIEPSDFEHATKQEISEGYPFLVIKDGEFHKVFTVVEIFLDLLNDIIAKNREDAIVEIKKAFKLSGSVYGINGSNRIELLISNDSAEKIQSIKNIISPFPEFCDRFFQAVGNLVGRKSKPEDIVKDIFVSAEGYLKAISGGSRFGDSIKELEKKSKINNEQKKVLEALNQFASDTSGTRHAGNSATPTEKDTLWFLDTLVAQLRMIDRNK